MSAYLILVPFTRHEGSGPPSKGEWKAVFDSKDSAWDSNRSATICCPVCGTLQTIVSHILGIDGSVKDAVTCSNLDCTFHDFITLQGWPPKMQDVK